MGGRGENVNNYRYFQSQERCLLSIMSLHYFSGYWNHQCGSHPHPQYVCVNTPEVPFGQLVTWEVGCTVVGKTYAMQWLGKEYNCHDSRLSAEHRLFLPDLFAGRIQESPNNLEDFEKAVADYRSGSYLATFAPNNCPPVVDVANSFVVADSQNSSGGRVDAELTGVGSGAEDANDSPPIDGANDDLVTGVGSTGAEDANYTRLIDPAKKAVSFSSAASSGGDDNDFNKDVGQIEDAPNGALKKRDKWQRSAKRSIGAPSTLR